MDCLSCGTSNCDDSRFCIGCGRQLSSTCPDCRRANLAQARFCAHCGAALCISQTLVQTAAATAAGQGSQLGERRQLTLMFCDMIGSTALSTQMDPESLHEIMHVYRKCCAQIIARFEGCVAQYVGDGILAYFSFPTRTRTTPSGRCMPAWKSSRNSAA
jgi:class 3 adenylate cyclase